MFHFQDSSTEDDKAPRYTSTQGDSAPALPESIETEEETSKIRKPSGLRIRLPSLSDNDNSGNGNGDSTCSLTIFNKSKENVSGASQTDNSADSHSQSQGQSHSSFPSELLGRPGYKIKLPKLAS